MSDDPTTAQWIGRALGRVGWGLVVLARRGWRWPWSTAEGGSKLGRLLALGAGAWAVLRVTGAIPWTRVAFVVGLIAWAYSQDAREVSRDGGANSVEEPESDEPSDDEINAAFRDAMLPRLRALIGDAKGVHLDVVHAMLDVEGHLAPGADLSALRRKLAAVGIPVRDSVKVHGLTRIGVHRDDLPDHSPDHF